MEAPSVQLVREPIVCVWSSPLVKAFVHRGLELASDFVTVFATPVVLFLYIDVE